MVQDDGKTGLGNRYDVGVSDERPWGSWRVIDVGPRFTVKRISVHPDQRLSLQLHNGRHEHWTVVAGRAEVTIGEKIVEIGENQAVEIPVRTKHRVRNPGPEELVFIEVQWGEHLDEDDIVRLEDDYGRG